MMKPTTKQKLCCYTDTQGLEWDLTINAGIYMMLQDIDIDITTIFSGEDNTLEEMIMGDRMMDILGVMGMICEKQFEARGMTKDDFYNSMDGEVIERATLAFLQAVINFSAAPKRQGMLAVLAQVQGAAMLTGEKIAEKVSSKEMTDEITNLVNQQSVDL